MVFPDGCATVDFVMKAHAWFLNRIVAALVSVLLLVPGAGAQSATLENLFAELADPENSHWERTELDIWREWSKSGSAAMDLLLERGRDAMDAGDAQAAIEHLTALIDHAPDFAEGWNARATAYFQAGQYGPSVQDIGRALTLNPRHFGALAGLGMILEELGYDDRAREAYRAALAIHPHMEGVKDALMQLEAKAAGQEL